MKYFTLLYFSFLIFCNCCFAGIIEPYPPQALIVELRLENLRKVLNTAPDEFTKLPKVRIELKDPSGNAIEFDVEKSQLLEKDLSNKYTDIKSYRCFSSDGIWFGRLMLTSYGLDGYFVSSNNAFQIVPNGDTNKDSHRAYWVKDDKRNQFINCMLEDEVDTTLSTNNNSFRLQNGSQLRSYRIAITNRAQPADFNTYDDEVPYNFNSVGNFITAVSVFLNKVNVIYEKEFSIHFNLIGNNNLLYQADTTHAGYPFLSSLGGFSVENVHNYITSTIGSGNFDVGHAMCGCGGSGLAGGSNICNNSGKGHGWSTYNNVGTMCHELGHQFGAGHTWNGTGCGVEWSSADAVEPGSGSTIMAYTGSCGVDNVYIDPSEWPILNFGVRSYEQIITFSTTAGGNTCPVITNTSNSPPLVTVPNGGFHIPKSTAFTLTGSATDPNGNALTHSWEEVDLGIQGPINSPVGNAPIFRVFKPIPITSRTFPKMYDIVNNTQTQGELMPSYERQLNFRMYTRDNIGGADYEQVQFNVSGNAGPFKVTSPGATVFTPSSNVLVNWNVAATTAPPVSCQNVDILLSTDGGYTFTTTLLLNTPNDGSQLVTLPNTTAGNCRIMVRATGNIFFDISDESFAITSNANNTNLALNFDGTNDIVDLIPFSKPTNFTLEMWLKTTNTSGIIFSWAGYTSNLAEVRISSGNIYYTEENAITPVIQTTANYNIGNNVWHHIAIVKNGTGTNNINIYVDGILRASGTCNLSISSSKVTIGGQNWYGSIYNLYNGSIDEVRIWNVARTVTQINSNMNCGLPSGTSGLIAYYNFNNPIAVASGTNTGITFLADNSGNLKSGTLNSFALSGATSNWIAGNATLNRLWYQDSDNDGYGNPAVTTCSPAKPIGYVANQLDCNDGNSSIYFSYTYYTDADGDGFGINSPTQFCLLSPPAGYASNSNDCNDASFAIHPGVSETCNNIDDNCDGFTDEGFDVDNDGIAVCMGDCNDNNPEIYLGAAELPGNAVDENCNGQLNENSALNFDGVNDYLKAPTSFQRPVEMTIEFWIKTSSTNRQSLVAWTSNGTSTHELYMQTNGELEYKEGGTYYGIAGPVNSGNWIHVAIVRTNAPVDNVKGYINGSHWYTGTFTTNYNTDEIYVGGLPTGSYFNGTMDELRIWNIALTPAQIQNNMFCSPLPSTTGIQLYYGFNEGIPSGNNVQLSKIYDLSTNGIKATLMNFAKSGNGSNWIIGTQSFNRLSFVEICNGEDDDCDGLVDEGFDSDNDGVSDCIDCDDNNPVVYTGAAEIPGNSLDENCNGQLNENSALNFDGINDYLNVVSFQRPQNMTIEFWIKTTSVARQDIILWRSTTSGGISELYFNPGNGSLVYIEGDNSGYYGYFVTGSINTGNWVHVAVVRTNAASSNIKGYVNGVLAATATLNIPSTTDQVFIGGQPTGSYLNGTLDEFKVWSEARSQSQIQASMNCSAPALTSGLELYYGFNEGLPVGNNSLLYRVYDLTLNNRAATLKNLSKTGSVSNWIAGTGNQPVTPTVSIAANPGNTICSGTSVIFTATPANGGSPTYLWKKNGTSTGVTSASYITSALVNGDQITCQLTSSLSCVTINPVTSTPIGISVISVPSVSGFTPTAGGAGTSVVIAGNNFVNVTSVKFNGIIASYIVNSPMQITATVPIGASTGSITVTTNCGSVNSSIQFTFIPSVTINLKLFIEGYYRGAGLMASVSNPSVCDTITLELRNSVSPFSIVSSVKSTINISGNGSFIFASSVYGTSCYLVVNHRNSLETWSSSAMSINNSSITYDFSNAANKAYGNKQKNLQDGRFAIYSGDINQNDTINSNDMILMKSSLITFETGYHTSDLTGDGFVESQDFSLLENNAVLPINISRP